MLADRLFLIVTLGVIPFWLMLICAPRWRWTRLIHGVAPFIVLAATYVWALTLEGDAPAGAGFTTLDGLLLLFSSRESMLVVWIHFIVVDLFAGAWIARDAPNQGIRHLWIVPILIVTFALAPLGLGSYLVLRSVRGNPVLGRAGSNRSSDLTAEQDRAAALAT